MNAATWFGGFAPFFRKELSEWLRGGGALVTVTVLSALGILGTLATRIDEMAGGTPLATNLAPTYNVIGAKFDQWIVFATVFASMGLIIGERSSGTLAWTLSKPISRSALYGAKWLVATGMLTVFGLAIPLAVSVGVATWAYGGVPDLGSVLVLGAWLATAVAFIVALNLCLATRIGSQAGIGAIAFGVAVVPYIAGALLPSLAEMWPTSVAIMAPSVAMGDLPNVATVAGWLICLVAFGGIGLVLFSREDM